MAKIKIESNDISAEAELNDSETSKDILKALPIEGKAIRWGEEVYFDIPVKQKLEEGARADVEVGELGYWPTGSAFCIFFGPTPASDSDKPKAASAVTILGKVIGDAKIFGKVNDGDTIKILQAD
jgi:hypothetical protein